jgi:hypothetical protein
MGDCAGLHAFVLCHIEGLPPLNGPLTQKIIALLHFVPNLIGGYFLESICVVCKFKNESFQQRYANLPGVHFLKALS